MLLRGTRWPPFCERLMYYLMIPDLFSRVFLEAGAGIYWYSITQPKQWVFYLLVFAEYCFSFINIGRKRFAFGENRLIILLFAVMFLHGILVGVIWFNKPTKILTDSIPVFVLLMNTICLCERDAYKGFSFDRLYRFVRVYGVTMIAVGFVAVKLGKPSIVNLGGAAGSSICLIVLLIGLAHQKRMAALDLLIFLGILGAVAPNLTRTALLGFVAAFLLLIVPKLMRDATKLYVGICLVVGAAMLAPVVIPPESPLMQRLEALSGSSDGGSGEGSIGERDAEVRAIDQKLRLLGTDAEWFGAGAGGTYWVEFSGGKIPENYSHAHFGWALFKLRYGYVGYAYLVIFSAVLLYNAVSGFLRTDPLGQCIGLVAFWGFVFVFTYMFFNQLVAGLQFAKPPQPHRFAQRRARLTGRPPPAASSRLETISKARHPANQDFSVDRTKATDTRQA